MTVETDPATLRSILKQKQVDARLGYWLGQILVFNIDVVCKPGRQKVVGDAIPRRPDFLSALASSKGDPKEGQESKTDSWREQHGERADTKVWEPFKEHRREAEVATVTDSEFHPGIGNIKRREISYGFEQRQDGECGRQGTTCEGKS